MGLTMAEAAERFALVNADLAANQQASITVGLTELDGDDRVDDLIGRADAAMYLERTPRNPYAPPPRNGV
jgi:PleD family two-component response regulator